MPLIPYKLILIHLDLQRLREIARRCEDPADADFLRRLADMAKVIEFDFDKVGD